MKVGNETGDIECAVIESFDGERSASKMIMLSDLVGVTAVENNVKLTVANVPSLRGRARQTSRARGSRG